MLWGQNEKRDVDNMVDERRRQSRRAYDSDLTKDKIVAAVLDAIDNAHHQCYPDDHKRFIDAMIERERIKAERWEAIKTHVLGWGIIAMVGALGSIIAKKLGL